MAGNAVGTRRQKQYVRRLVLQLVAGGTHLPDVLQIDRDLPQYAAGVLLLQLPPQRCHGAGIAPQQDQLRPQRRQIGAQYRPQSAGGTGDGDPPSGQ